MIESVGSGSLRIFADPVASNAKPHQYINCFIEHETYIGLRDNSDSRLIFKHRLFWDPQLNDR